MSTVQREAFRVSRSMEYFSGPELTKQIGYRQDLWPLAIAKELVDNAVDAAEEAGRLPEVSVTLDESTLTVTDNGGGIPPETVESMLDLDSRVSSREAYRGITRGAQGNAAKCMLGIPVVLNGGSGHVTISGQGHRHDIDVRVVGGQALINPDWDYCEEQIGTTVSVSIDDLASKVRETGTGRFVLFGESYAALNPHLTLSLTLPDGTRREWKRLVDGCFKWTPDKADPPGWHDDESFERLLTASILKDRAENKDRLLSDFVGQFAGMKRSAVRGLVLGEAGLKRQALSSLWNGEGLDREKASRLLGAMIEHGKTPKPEMLGVIGRTRMAQVFERAGIHEIKHKKVVGEWDGLPFVVEAAFGWFPPNTHPVDEACEREAIVITGCNFSPSIYYSITRDLGRLLEEQKVDEVYSPVMLVLHIAKVAPVYLDRGKTQIDPEGDVEDAIEQCVKSVTEDYAREMRAMEREEDRRERRRERRAKPKRKVTLKDAVLRVLPEAIKDASGGGRCDFDARDLYYAARPLVQKFTNADLSQKYFDKVIDDWELEHGLIPNRMRSPRGFVREPHTNERIPLGTREVNDYIIPPYLYHTLIYVEKKGLLGKFEFGDIPDRYDCAIICAEGYAVNAAKALIQAAQAGYKTRALCFHDADAPGYNIARTLSRDTGAHRYDIEIIDAGLHLAEAIEMGLAVETHTRQKDIPQGVAESLTELEREYFGGTPRRRLKTNGRYKTVWEGCRRVELNALSCDPERFVQWMEGKLVEHGVAKKVVPPEEVVKDQARQRLEEMLRDEIMDQLLEHLDLNAVADRLVEKYSRQLPIERIPKVVADWAAELKPERWLAPIDREVRHGVCGLTESINQAIVRHFER